MPVCTRRALLAGLGALAALPATARPFDEVSASGVLRVALYADNAPFSDLVDGKPAGIDVAVAEALAEALKLKLDLRLVDSGENVDGDFRLNLWRGDLAGTPLADLMLHVPNDKILGTRNEQVFLVRPYLEQRLAFAWRRGTMEGLESFQDIEGHTVAVESASTSDMQLLLAESGRYRQNLKHFRNVQEAARAFLAGETQILAGTRAAIEAALHGSKANLADVPVVELALTGPIRSRWDLGGAVRSDSRDLGYAVGEALGAMVETGELKAICARYGVTYTAPSGF